MKTKTKNSKRRAIAKGHQVDRFVWVAIQSRIACCPDGELESHLAHFDKLSKRIARRTRAARRMGIDLDQQARDDRN